MNTGAELDARWDALNLKARAGVHKGLRAVAKLTLGAAIWFFVANYTGSWVHTVALVLAWSMLALDALWVATLLYGVFVAVYVQRSRRSHRRRSCRR